MSGASGAESDNENEEERSELPHARGTSADGSRFQASPGKPPRHDATYLPFGDLRGGRSTATAWRPRRPAIAQVSTIPLPTVRLREERRAGTMRLVPDPNHRDVDRFDLATHQRESRAARSENALRIQALASPFIGESAAEFVHHLRPLGCEVRVVVEDSRGAGALMDYRPRRVNVVVTRGVVTEIQFIG